MYSAFVLSLNIMFEKHLACLFVFSELQDYGSGSGPVASELIFMSGSRSKSSFVSK
jgi:hypothetical protein